MKFLVDISDEAVAVAADYAQHKGVPVESALREIVEIWAMGVRARQEHARVRKAEARYAASKRARGRV
jgi:hypothetical protein